MQSLDRRSLQTVTVAKALWDEVDDSTAEHLEGAAQDHGRGDAIHIVVAVHSNTFTARQRLLEADDGAFHIHQPKWVVQMIEGRMEEPFSCRRIAQSAQAQQSRDGRVKVQSRRQDRCLPVVAREMIPEERLHGAGRKSVGFFSASTNAMPSDPIRRNLS